MSDLVPTARNAVERIAYRPAEAAARVGCTRRHIYTLINDGTLPSVRLGGARFISAAALERVFGADDTTTDAR